MRAIDATSPSGGGASAAGRALRAAGGGIRDLAKRLAAQSPCTCRGLRRVPLRSANWSAPVSTSPATCWSTSSTAAECLRSTFMYLGWLCGADPDDAALRAASGLELLHAFALLQDDVMDDSPLRRGPPRRTSSSGAGTVTTGFPVSSERFGASCRPDGDLCLVWAEQMMRESGVSSEALVMAWPHYDDMRIELAVGQSPTSPTTREQTGSGWFSTSPGASPATSPCAVHWRSARRWPAANR